MVELLSGGGLDDNASAYLAAVENFERISQSVFIELGAHPLPLETSVVDASSLASTTGPILLSAFSLHLCISILGTILS